MKISIITPCYNEEANIEACAKAVADVMAESLAEYDYEHIFCDNSSTDRSVAVLRKLAASDSRIKVIVNSRNVGPFRNMANGLKSASGDLVVPMVPADIQDPPSAIPDMVAKLVDGVDVVYGWSLRRRSASTPFLMFGAFANTESHETPYPTWLIRLSTASCRRRAPRSVGH